MGFARGVRRNELSSKYHPGETEVQTRAGVQKMAARASDAIRPEIPPYTCDFLEDQRMVVVGSIGADGRVWASLLTGEPGFLRVLDERTLRLDARPVPGDPLDENLKPGMDVGLLSIDLSTRRRIRLNGKAERRPEGIYVYAEQVYGNCPKYIQMREPEATGGSPTVEPGIARHSGSLTDAQRRLISSSDTFFIASAHPGGGADASHRGGLPGFVRFLDEETLAFPDYSGNNMFNTLGNIAANPKAGLLFVDFERGHTLQLSGEACVIWDPARAAEFAGARRLVEFRVGKVVENTVRLRWRFAAYSPFNPAYKLSEKPPLPLSPTSARTTGLEAQRDDKGSGDWSGGRGRGAPYWWRLFALPQHDDVSFPVHRYGSDRDQDALAEPEGSQSCPDVFGPAIPVHEQLLDAPDLSA